MDNVLVWCICFGNNPSQGDINNAKFSRLYHSRSPRKTLLHEVIPLGMHVVERAAHKDADSLPGEGHGLASRCELLLIAGVRFLFGNRTFLFQAIPECNDDFPFDQQRISPPMRIA